MVPVGINSKLPPETIDRIIDHLHDDKPSLAVCSLACKQWEPACRFHLFHSISFVAKNDHDMDNILNRQRRWDEVSHLLGHTEQFRIDFLIDGAFDVIHLWSMLPYMPHLRSLRLNATINRMKHFRERVPPGSPDFLTFPVMQTLILETRSMVTLPADDIPVLLHMFPNLRNLLMLGPYFATHTPDDTRGPPVLPQSLSLTSLKFDKLCLVTAHNFLQAISLTSTVHSLTSLDVGYLLGSDKHRAFKNTAAQIKNTLQSLRLGLGDPLSMFDPSTLGKCRNQIPRAKLISCPQIMRQRARPWLYTNSRLSVLSPS